MKYTLKQGDGFIVDGYDINNQHKIVDVLNLPEIPQDCESITYNELLDLRDNDLLSPGTFYRITNYNCTSCLSNTKIGAGQFDIIVLALSETELSENAYACHHDGDSTFINSNVQAWKIKYCLDNDRSRFEWAADGKSEHPTSLNFSENGIYKLYDDINEIICDFETKNIEYRYYWEYSGNYPALYDYILEYDIIQYAYIDPWNLPDDIEYGSENDTYPLTINVGKTLFKSLLEKLIKNAPGYFSFKFKLVNDFVYTNTDEFYTTTLNITKNTPVEIPDWYEIDHVGIKNDEIIEILYDNTGTSGKGVIYYMQDEFGNEFPYDFKSLKFYDVNNNEYYYSLNNINNTNTDSNIVIPDDVVTNVHATMLVDNVYDENGDWQIELYDELEIIDDPTSIGNQDLYIFSGKKVNIELPGYDTSVFYLWYNAGRNTAGNIEYALEPLWGNNIHIMYTALLDYNKSITDKFNPAAAFGTIENGLSYTLPLSELQKRNNKIIITTNYNTVDDADLYNIDATIIVGEYYEIDEEKGYDTFTWYKTINNTYEYDNPNLILSYVDLFLDGSKRFEEYIYNFAHKSIIINNTRYYIWTIASNCDDGGPQIIYTTELNFSGWTFGNNGPIEGTTNYYPNNFRFINGWVEGNIYSDTAKELATRDNNKSDVTVVYATYSDKNGIYPDLSGKSYDNTCYPKFDTEGVLLLSKLRNNVFLYPVHGLNKQRVHIFNNYEDQLINDNGLINVGDFILYNNNSNLLWVSINKAAYQYVYGVRINYKYNKTLIHPNYPQYGYDYYLNISDMESLWNLKISSYIICPDLNPEGSDEMNIDISQGIIISDGYSLKVQDTESDDHWTDVQCTIATYININNGEITTNNYIPLMGLEDENGNPGYSYVWFTKNNGNIGGTTYGIHTTMTNQPVLPNGPLREDATNYIFDYQNLENNFVDLFNEMCSYNNLKDKRLFVIGLYDMPWLEVLTKSADFDLLIKVAPHILKSLKDLTAYKFISF